MSTWLDTKYVNLLGSQLLNFKRKSQNLWNFRCPFCGDSKKNLRKARGFIHTSKGGELMYTCHNDGCGSHSISTLIKEVNPVLFSEYKKELMIEKYGEREEDTTIEDFEKKVTKPIFFTHSALKNLQKVSSLKEGHPCKKYVVGRQIPSNLHYKLYYVPKFMEWTNTIIPNKFDGEALKYDEPRLVMPYLNKAKEMFGYGGRSLNPKAEVRYISIILNDSFPKLYGLEDVDEDRMVYVLEGPFDAMFIDNAVAVCGGELNTAVHYFKKDKFTLVFDNEPRSSILCKKIQNAINNGISVCIWPHGIEEKDVNEMVLKDMRPEYIKTMIEVNTFTGLEAQLNFNKWKKC